MTIPTSRSPSSAHNGNGRTRLEKAANLSTVLTLVALLGIGASAQKKLDTIDSRGRNNCRAINNGILLTLEASRSQHLTARQETQLNRVESRFQRLQNQC